MKKISSIFIATSLLLLSVSINAQTVPVEKIQKLLDKAAGQKYLSIVGSEQKLTKQVFTVNSYVMSYTGLGKYGSKWVLEYTGINWYSGFNHFSTTENSNSKLTRFVFDLKDKHSFYMHVEGEGDNKKSTRNSLEFYVLTKDAEEMEALLKTN